jgi:hypothetical protein
MRLAACAAFVLCAGFVGCTFGSASPATGARTSGSPLAKATGQLDAQVPMPANFPPDMPIYTGARLAAGASFESPGQVAWGMEWETLDPLSKVKSYYEKEMAKGDWSVTFSSMADNKFTATFARKSNSHAKGTLVGDSGSGLTKILMSFTSPR